MLSNDEERRKKGEVILNNYKRQLAERMARERLEKGDVDQSVSGKSNNDSMAKQ